MVFSSATSAYDWLSFPGLLEILDPPSHRPTIWYLGVLNTILRATAVRRFGHLFVAAFFAMAALSNQSPLFAADFSDAERAFRSGDYATAESIAQAEVERGVWNEQWSKLLIRCQMTRGGYAEALEVYRKAISRYSSSLSLRLLGRDVMRLNGLSDDAKQEAALVMQTLQRSPSRYLSRDNMVAAGRYFADRGEDARQVLELFYDRVRDVDPEFVDAFIATAELALLKGDYKVASETLEKAAKLAPNDPTVAYLTALAWQSTDRKRFLLELDRALVLNPAHVPSLLLIAEDAIDREQYATAHARITEVLSINPHQWEAWSYLAVLAHLDGKYEIEKLMRAAALSTWQDNPEVDYLIGRKLSDKYRFNEGSEYQRRALVFDPNFHRASFQLAQDLLRLGFDDVGWELADRVALDDPYNVVAHNLVTLHDLLRNFTVLQQDDLYVRMDPKEASIYGDRVLDLLTDAKQTLSEKYGVALNEPIFVEIFPSQKDFAIRTFGLPGGDGFLGVCFGRVVTANSPASQGPRPSNWESVLWHEFCHVVTLEKTRNRMPRWLSEGISVYEERQRNPAWGEKMIPQYREMILGEALTPVSQLSGAFLAPKSALHLQFAYYESSLVIEYMVDKYGIEKLNQILESLGDGVPANAAIEMAVGSLERLDTEFAEYARAIANSFAPRADWDAELPESIEASELEGWALVLPNSYPVLDKLASVQIANRDFAGARKTLEHLEELGAVTGTQGGVLERLAIVYRELAQADDELRVLMELSEISSDALPALERLIELARKREDWQEVARLGDIVLAIHPLRPLGHEALADAGEQLDRPDLVARGTQALLRLDPIDRAGMHYRCAEALAKIGDATNAKQHVMEALLEAPRYRAAHRLFHQLVSASQDADEKPDSPPINGTPEGLSEDDEK